MWIITSKVWITFEIGHISPYSDIIYFTYVELVELYCALYIMLVEDKITEF